MLDRGLGVSKHAEKAANADRQPDRDKIHSYNTYKGYLSSSIGFLNWVKEHYGCRYLVDAREHVPEYLMIRRDTVAASTVAHDASSLAKLYHCGKRDFGVKLPKRERRDYVKNRGDNWVGEYSRELHADLDRLCAGTGLRRCEIPRVSPAQVVVRDGQTWVEGVKGKGGKIRDIPVIREHAAFMQELAARAQANGSKRLYTGSIPKRAPIHADRGQRYARSLYLQHARSIKDIPKAEQYRCRKEMRGQIYDKAALWVVTQALGHSRLSVVMNYLR